METTEGQVLRVLENENRRVSIDIKKQFYERGMWQTSRIPYTHASICILNVGREVKDFVDPLLTKDRYMPTYALMMQLVPDEKCWPNLKFQSLLPPQNGDTTQLNTSIHKVEKREFNISMVKEVNVVMSLY